MRPAEPEPRRALPAAGTRQPPPTVGPPMRAPAPCRLPPGPSPRLAVPPGFRAHDSVRGSHAAVPRFPACVAESPFVFRRGIAVPPALRRRPTVARRSPPGDACPVGRSRPEREAAPGRDRRAMRSRWRGGARWLRSWRPPARCRLPADRGFGSPRRDSGGDAPGRPSLGEGRARHPAWPAAPPPPPGAGTAPSPAQSLRVAAWPVIPRRRRGRRAGNRGPEEPRGVPCALGRRPNPQPYASLPPRPIRATGSGRGASPPRDDDVHPPARSSVSGWRPAVAAVPASRPGPSDPPRSSPARCSGR